MKKTILSLAVAEIIIGYSMQANAHAATIENINSANENATAIFELQADGKIISVGSKGDVVRSIQKVLNYLEGGNIQEDGIYGPETYNAVVKFQAKNGLKQDGIIGKQTASKLINIDTKPKWNMNDKIENAIEITDKVEAEGNIIEFQLNSNEISTETNYFIVVNKSKKQVQVYYKEIGSWINMREFPCNIGESDTSTIEWNFYSGLKGKELRLNDKYVKYFTQINGGYLFHSTAYNELGEVLDDCIENSISQGCIGLSLEDSKYIYDVIPAGTGIKIIE